MATFYFFDRKTLLYTFYYNMGSSMSVNLTETNYRIVRNNDPTFQAMSRVADTNNIYDIYQEYV